MGTKGSGASRAGGDGIHNEDAFLVHEGLGLYVVCDGASDSPAGELAARIAAESIAEFVNDAGRGLDLGRGAAAREIVEEAMRRALDAVVEAEEADANLAGLETTVTLLLAHGDLGVFGHRGDSRAILIRRDRAQQLTLDHELTQATLGHTKRTEAFDVFALALRPGDTIVLCTDGAEEVLNERSFIKTAGEVSTRILASRIVSEANRRNPDQDATAVVVRVPPEAEPAWLELSGPPRRTAFGHTLSLA